MNSKVFALITAAGMSNRMGGVKKELILLNDKPLLKHTLIPFEKSVFIKKIFITYNEKDYDFFSRIIEEADFKTPVELVKGGGSRQESVHNGLKAMEKDNPDYVLIHDGARPSISRQLIKDVYLSVCAHGASAPVIPVTDSLKKTDKDGFLSEHPDRSDFKAVQTPQGFLFDKILDAHNKASCDNMNYNDDTEIYSRYIGKVSTVEGSKKNLKITYREDISFFSEEEK